MPARTRRQHREGEHREACAQAATATARSCGPLWGLLGPDQILGILMCVDGVTLARLECTCRLFGGRCRGPGGEPHQLTIVEDAARLACLRAGVGPPSLWARAVGASYKEQLHRRCTPAAMLRRRPVPISIGLRGPSGPCFTQGGEELWVAEYDGRCVARVGWDVGRGQFRVVARHRIPVALRSTAAAVSLSPDGSRLAVRCHLCCRREGVYVGCVTVGVPRLTASPRAGVAVGVRAQVSIQPHYASSGDGAHGILLLDASSGAVVSSWLGSDGEHADGEDGGGGGGGGDDSDALEYPSACQWMSSGPHAGALAIADFNNGRVQLREPGRGRVLRNVRLTQQLQSSSGGAAALLATGGVETVSGVTGLAG
eukprot:COSAG01_NODE_9811_length_2337_cov_21.693029_2_plen_370_part_00